MRERETVFIQSFVKIVKRRKVHYSLVFSFLGETREKRERGSREKERRTERGRARKDEKRRRSICNSSRVRLERNGSLARSSLFPPFHLCPPSFPLSHLLPSH